MSKLGLTPEEQAVVAHFVGSKGNAPERWLGHVSNVLPSVVIGTYGIVTQQINALVVAVIVGVALQVTRWPVEARYEALYRAIFRKLDAFERRGDSEAS